MATLHSMWQWICLTLLYSVAVIILPVKSQTVPICHPSPSEGRRVDCGSPGMTQAQCEITNGCCWDTSVSGIPWCYHMQYPSCPNIAPGDRRDCGTAGMTDLDCLNRSCCWDTTFTAVPWCFHNQQDMCVVAVGDREDCGYLGISQDDCENNSTISPPCCWVASGGTGPQCFFPLGTDTTTVNAACAAILPAIVPGTTPLCFPNNPNTPISQALCNFHGCCYHTDNLCYSSVPVTTTTPTTTPTTTTPTTTPTTTTPTTTTPTTTPNVCPTSGITRRDCGYAEITSANCQRGGKCCYDDSTFNTLHCYFDITVPDPIPVPSVCNNTVSTGVACAADPDTSITETKCIVLGCCWDPNAAVGAQCYDAPPTTTPPTTTTQPTTTTDPGIPDVPDIPVIVPTPDLTSLNMTGVTPTDGVVYMVTWWLDDLGAQTTFVNSGDDVDTLLFDSFSFISNPEIIVCVAARYESSDEYGETVCSEPYRVVQVKVGAPFAEGIIIQEGYRVEVPISLVGIPDLLCSTTPSQYQLELQIVVDGELQVSCGPDGVAIVNQGASLFEEGTPAGSCSSVIDPADFVDVDAAFQLFGVIDNRVEGATNFTVRVQVTKVANQGSPTFGSCTVDAGIFNVVVIDNSPGVQACKVGYPFNIQQFDYRSIDSNLVNVFLLLRHQTLPYEIHIMTKAVRVDDSPYEIAALCGVAVRSGSSVLMMSRCGGDSDGLDADPMEVRALLPDGELYEGTKLFRNRQGGYTVIFPHGGELRVTSGDNGPDGFVSLIYSPSPLDFGEVEGLCGSYEGPSQAGPPGAVDIVNGNLEVHMWRVLSTGNIFNQGGGSGPPSSDWCSCQALIFGTNCFGKPYDRCDLTLRPITPRLIDRATPDDAQLIIDWTDDAITTPVGPLVTFVPPNPFTYDTAETICEQKILYTDLARLCEPLIPLSYQTAVQVCIDLIGRTGSDAGVPLIVEGIKSECLQATTMFVEIPDELAGIFSLLCPNDCGDYGYCLDARCICSAGFTGPDCEQPPDGPPMVTGIQGGGMCVPDDTESCNSITIYGSFNPSLSYICSLQFICPLTGENLWTEVTYPASDIQRSEITCPVPGGRSALITVMDSRDRPSANSLPYIVYDPACTRCSIMNTYNYQCMTVGRGCYIMKRCFEPNAPHPRDMCRYCDPAQNHTGWTRREGEECALPVRPETGTGVSFTTFLLLVCLSVFLGLLFIIICACMCHRATTICRRVNGLDQDGYLCDTSTAYGSGYGSANGGSIYSGSGKSPWGVYAIRDNWNYGHQHSHHH